MRIKRETGTAFAICAAIAGAGFASGREIVTFFSCTGWASWLGIVVASVLAGLLTALLTALARRGRTRSFPGIYSATMGRECGEAVELLHGLTMLLTASVMLTAAGELGALALNLRYAYPLAMAASLVCGLLLSTRGFRRLRLFGALLVPFVCLFYLSLALDPSPAPEAFIAVPGFRDLDGSPIAACLLGVLYAALNSAMSGGVLAALAQGDCSPAGLGMRTGLMLLAMLAPANAALLRAGAQVRQLALPSVVLAARWGRTGFALSVLALWLSVVTTLAAALGSLRGQARERGLNPHLTLGVVSLAAVGLSVIGFKPLVQVGYPLLGWVCALALMALIPFVRAEKNG